MNVAHAPGELERRPRAVAIGTFDGVHVGHRAVVGAALDAGLTPTVVTFHPHPREVLGYEVELLVDPRAPARAAGRRSEWRTRWSSSSRPRSPGSIRRSSSRPTCSGSGPRCSAPASRSGSATARSGDLALCERLGLETRVVPIVPGVSSTEIRRLAAAGEVRAAAPLLGRPLEVEGVVVSGDARGGTLGFPTANLRIEHSLLVPAFGIYAGAALDHRAAISIGLNPHYGGTERRIEAFLLDFTGDLYGQRVIVELWDRLRDEASFASEADLIAQIAVDVEATRATTRP